MPQQNFYQRSGLARVLGYTVFWGYLILGIRYLNAKNWVILTNFGYIKYIKYISWFFFSNFGIYMNSKLFLDILYWMFLLGYIGIPLPPLPSWLNQPDR